MIKMDKIKIYIKNIIYGFLLSIIPIIIMSIADLFLGHLFTLKLIFSEITKYGLIGIAISILYSYLSKSYPQFAKTFVLIVLILYYLINLIYLIANIYFYNIGPLFG